MSKIPERWDETNQWYFITSVCDQRHPWFSDDAHCELFLQTCKEVRRHRNYRMAGLALLPEHWHALLRPGEHWRIEEIVGALKKTFLKFSLDMIFRLKKRENLIPRDETRGYRNPLEIFSRKEPS
ncbi:transposase [Deltaproteobacteria bacterium TL4]